MEFYTPLKTPEDIVSFIERAIKKEAPPAKIAAAVQKDTGNVLVTLSKFGTTEILVILTPMGDGLKCETQIQKLNSLHKPYMPDVERWVIDNIALASGGMVFVNDSSEVHKLPFLSYVFNFLFLVSFFCCLYALLY